MSRRTMRLARAGTRGDGGMGARRPRPRPARGAGSGRQRSGSQSLDVSVARFAPSKNVSYAMFSGGGLAWAERAMKAGRFAVAPGAAGTRPRLSAECPAAGMTFRATQRYHPFAVPCADDDTATPHFDASLEELLADLENSPDVARPVPEGGPALGWPPPGADLEAQRVVEARRVTFAASIEIARWRP